MPPGEKGPEALKDHGSIPSRKGNIHDYGQLYSYPCPRIYQGLRDLYIRTGKYHNPLSR